MTIPASDIVVVNPGVIGTGGNPLALNGVMLTQNGAMVQQGVMSFTSPQAVSQFFGPASAEYAEAQIYFLGFDNSTLKPGTLFFAPFAPADRAAFMRSGSFAGVTLSQLQGLSGILTVTVDGTGFTSSSINLSSATSFTNAATLMTAAFTGSPKPTVTWDSITSTFLMTSGTTGASSSITFCTGSGAIPFKFTSATGATLSQGRVADTPATAMANVIGVTQNWVDFMTLWEPITADKLAFAAWTNLQNQRYAYIAWDSDAQASVNGSTTSFGYQVKALAYDGIVPISGYAPDVVAEGSTLAAAALNVAAFILGTVGSIDFSRLNARITSAFKSQSGLLPTVVSEQPSANLLANGYSFYGAYATANQGFVFFYNGQMSGKWAWLDTFVDQVYLNSQFQLALMELLTQVTSIPYNQSGYDLIRAAMSDPILQALNFGSIRPGIVLSNAQKAEVNQAAGVDAATPLQQQGYYLQILDPGAQVRGQRGTPVINFWYTDGGAVQKITVASIDVM